MGWVANPVATRLLPTMSLVREQSWEANYLGGRLGSLVYSLVFCIRNKHELCWGNKLLPSYLHLFHFQDIWANKNSAEDVPFQVKLHMTRNQLRVAIECHKGVKVKVVKWCWKKWNGPILMHIYAKQCEIMQKNQWKGSNGQIHCFCKGKSAPRC